MSENAAAETSAAGAGSPALPPTNRDLSPEADPPKQSRGRRQLGGSSLTRNLGLVVALLLLCLVGFVTAGESFVRPSNFATILGLAATTGIISIGMTFVITGGGIDLSVGSVMGLATVWATTLATQTMARDYHWAVMVFAALAVGAIAGLINGVVVAYGRVVSFIATLARLVAARGLAEMISGRQTQLIPHNSLLEGQSVNGFKEFFGGDLLGLPVIVWVFVVVAALGWVLLNRTTFGRRTIAVGGNPEAARLAGIKIQRHTMYLFALAGFTAGIAAVTMMARTGAGTSTHGMLFELDVIAAVVVGGTLLVGGRGTIVGTVLGVLIFATLNNIFVLNNLSTSVQSVAKGAIIVLAVLLQQRFANKASG